MRFNAITLAAVLAALLALAATAWRIHVKADQAGYMRAQSEQTQAALDASELRRHQERALSLQNQRIDNDQAMDRARRDARTADLADRLRQLQAAAASADAADSAATSELDDPPARVASQCAAALVRLDRYAQSLASQTAGLQDYASSVCVAPR